MTPEKPGSVAFPLPGFNTDIFDEDANSVPLGYGGNIVNKTPWPSMLRAFFRDDVRYKKEYWEMYWQTKPGTYLAGDKATRDKDGYWWIQGRIDDVLKVAGHRISNAEVESAAVSHPKVAEAAVIGEPDEVKGEKIVAFVILKDGVAESEDLKKDISTHVRKSSAPLLIRTRSSSSRMCQRQGQARSCAESSRRRLWARRPATCLLWPTRSLCTIYRSSPNIVSGSPFFFG